MRPFDNRDKIGYLFGDFGNDFFFFYISAYLMLFYTDVVGLSPVTVGTIFIAARIWDAFADVLWGRFIDSRPATKRGKFRPWILRMFLPMIIFGVLTFTYFPNMDINTHMIYSLLTYVVWGTLYSTVNIPYGSMASVISTDPIERASLSTFRSMGSSLGGIAIGLIVPLVVFVNNKPVGSRFTKLAVVFAICATICYLLCYYLCIERVKTQVGVKQKFDFKVTAKGIVRNRGLISLIFAALAVIFATLLSQGLNSYLFKDYFQNTIALTVAGVVTVLPILIIAPAVSTIVKKFGKKESAAIGVLLSAIIFLLMFLLPIRSPWVFITFLFFGGLGVGFFNATIWAFITDVVDYQEYLTGTREDGTIYSVYSFSRKIGQALSGGLSGFALAAIGYISVPKGQPAVVQTPEVANSIKGLATLGPAICYFVIFIILQFWYPLGKGKLSELQAYLKEKHTGDDKLKPL
ncbi:MFS transporter [Ruminiclostridium cellulolyticum]|uniref:Sugar (Glycoside-Pentoside-Hexuronide) transporter n=1 Tax=Ruminiclostridium cellulolyticum (strain ATCC 35319 / DSM 5812 / JCM 6584 / H10) TaxID=394503 RepID=B8I2N3_RUMCH|nr:glycoside-pentoside-hexuronide (GPH):cation symporter [Ruminiclostridium cellulolyticum]ACL76026.1 sugar (Glycoside-Pentoside-Hexuronide) transporter [Ruminiclostridium cellulolyticum H10]